MRSVRCRGARLAAELVPVAGHCPGGRLETMPDQISFLQPETPSRDYRPGSLSSLPADLLDQIRGRVRLLAIFLTVGFSIDPVLYFANLGAARLANVQLPGEADFYCDGTL